MHAYMGSLEWKPCFGRARSRSVVGSIVAASVLLLCLQAAVAPSAGATDRAYAYRTYHETMAYFYRLKLDYPHLVEFWIAQKEFPEILPSRTGFGNCGSEQCRTLIVRIASKVKLRNEADSLRRPEVFLSGALHGDERLGPLVVTELAGFLCAQYERGNEEIRRLVDTRNTWIMPITNAYGFAHNVRHENGLDPNRDFPYLQKAARCMQTQTGRAVNELFRRHLFQFVLTFHGGMRALTFEWGSRNHMRNGKSTESPDDRAFTAVGEQIRAASGIDVRGHPWYPFGRINDLVYPVDGGMEDWSYAAGFERSPSPITVCKPQSYGGYAELRTRYREGSVAALVFLAEMDDDKTPRPSTLGRTAEVWGLSRAHGHVARNLRMCLKVIELAKPEVIVHPPAWPHALQPGTEVALDVHGFGCITLSSARLLLVRRAQVDDCRTLNPSAKHVGSRTELLTGAAQLATTSTRACRGLSIWQHPDPSSAAIQLHGQVPPGLSGEFCAAVAAEFDQDWGQQAHPDPAIRPRAHAARLRLEEHYVMEASDGLAGAGDGRMRIDEHRTKLFPVFAEPVLVQAAATGMALPTALAQAAVPSLPANKSHAFLAPPVAGPSAAKETGPMPVPEAHSQPAAAASAVPGPPASPTDSATDAGGVSAFWVLSVLAALAISCSACYFLGALRFGRSGCRSLPSFIGKTVIGQQASTEPAAAGQMEAAE